MSTCVLVDFMPCLVSDKSYLIAMSDEYFDVQKSKALNFRCVQKGSYLGTQVSKGTFFYFLGPYLFVRVPIFNALAQSTKLRITFVCFLG